MWPSEEKNNSNRRHVLLHNHASNPLISPFGGGPRRKGFVCWEISPEEGLAKRGGLRGRGYEGGNGTVRIMLM